MPRTGKLAAAFGVALLLLAACVVLWEPWHGRVILSLSPGHGIDTGDLPAVPLLALAVAAAYAQTQDARADPKWGLARWVGPASAVLLGALLLAGLANVSGGRELVPAGGGTFGGSTLHADGRRAEPVNRWSHVALTYDGARLRLYVDGAQVSSRAITGTIRKTTDPMWIGGNHPYGEYFEGLIDEVRVYDRALSPSQLRAEMSTPIASAATPPAGLVGAYAFDAGSGTVAEDSSGSGNAGTIIGPTRTPRGRFGSALGFDGSRELVRVPASASLNLRGAMTLSAWIRPGKSQSGWRTILHRQTDAYFLAAAGATATDIGAGPLGDGRAALLVCASIWFCLLAGSGHARWMGERRHSWWLPVMLFVVGSLVDAALPPSGTLVGPTLVAMWFALTASHRGEAAFFYAIAVGFTAVTIVFLADRGGLQLAPEDGGVARSAALGLLLVVAGLLGAGYGSRHVEGGGAVA